MMTNKKVMSSRKKNDDEWKHMKTEAKWSIDQGVLEFRVSYAGGGAEDSKEAISGVERT